MENRYQAYREKSFYVAVDSILFFTGLKFILTYIGKIFLGGNIQVSLFI